MKHVIYLHPHFTISWWAGNYVLETAKRIAKEPWYKVHIVSWKQDKNIVWWYDDINFEEVDMPLSSSFSFWMLFPIWTAKVMRTVKNIIDSNDWEFIIFAHVFPANWWWWIFKLFYKKYKLVFMCHEPSAFVWEKKWINAIPSKIKRGIAKFINPVMKIIDKFLVRKSDLILANSKFTEERIKKIYWWHNDVAYPWYDENIFKRNPNIKKENFFLAVWRHTKFKRFDFIIKVFSEFYREYPNYQLRIAGKWEETRNLKKLVNELKLEDCVKFLWLISLEDLVENYQKAQATLFASVDEPFGMAPIESMACWTITIWHDSWWMKETIPDRYRYKNETDMICKMKECIGWGDIGLEAWIEKFKREKTSDIILKYLTEV